jgi:hypothetical protein
MAAAAAAAAAVADAVTRPRYGRNRLDGRAALETQSWTMSETGVVERCRLRRQYQIVVLGSMREARSASFSALSLPASA